jgi:hypothetical protein
MFAAMVGVKEMAIVGELNPEPPAACRYEAPHLASPAFPARPGIHRHARAAMVGIEKLACLHQLQASKFALCHCAVGHEDCVRAHERKRRKALADRSRTLFGDRGTAPPLP